MPDPARALGYPLAALRALAILLSSALMLGGLLALYALLPGRRTYWGATFRRHWGAVTCRLLGVRLVVEGSLPSRPVVFAANHRSWVDAPALLAALPCTLLSKADVAHYPVIGLGARAVGIAFVRRESARSRGAALAELRATLATGASVGLFAEGTTSAWGELLELQWGAFRLAAQPVAGQTLPIVPVALGYDRPEACWQHQSLAAHFFAQMGRWRQSLRIVIGPELLAADAHALRSQCRQWLVATLERLEPPASAIRRAAETPAASR